MAYLLLATLYGASFTQISQIFVPGCIASPRIIYCKIAIIYNFRLLKYKIVFNVVDIFTEEFFCYRPNTCSYTRGHPFKLFKKRPVSSTKAIFSVIASLMFGTPCLLPMYTLHLWLYIPSLHSKGRSVRLYKRF